MAECKKGQIWNQKTQSCVNKIKKKPYRSPSQPEGKPYKAGQEYDKPKNMSEADYQATREGRSKTHTREWSKKHKRPIVRLKNISDVSGKMDIRRPKKRKK